MTFHPCHEAQDLAIWPYKTLWVGQEFTGWPMKSGQDISFLKPCTNVFSLMPCSVCNEQLGQCGTISDRGVLLHRLTQGVLHRDGIYLLICIAE